MDTDRVLCEVRTEFLHIISMSLFNWADPWFWPSTADFSTLRLLFDPGSVTVEFPSGQSGTGTGFLPVLSVSFNQWFHNHLLIYIQSNEIHNVLLYHIAKMIHGPSNVIFFYLHAVVTRRTSRRSLGTFKKAMLFRKSVSSGYKRSSETFFFSVLKELNTARVTKESHVTEYNKGLAGNK